MNEIETILEQARQLFVSHAPAELLKQAMPFAIVCLVAGIGFSVLGAKIARFGLACAFAVLGGYIGAFFAHETGFSVPVCGLISALMIGTIGYQTFRLWVGLAAAVVLLAAVLGAFGYQRVLPHMTEFQQSLVDAPVAVDGTFALHTPEQQQATLDRGPREWAEGLWTFVTARDASAAPNGRALAVAAMVIGLCLGVLAVRWALIISTSIVGTSLVTTGMATLLYQSVPESYQAFEARPGLAGIGIGGFLVTSLIIQTMLTRNAPASNANSGKS